LSATELRPMSIFHDPCTTSITPAVLTVAHPSWCTTADCRPTPDWDRDGTGFVNHAVALLDADELRVLVMQGETISPQGEVIERDPVVVLVDGVGDRELTADLAAQLADAVARAAAVAGGAR
jgi:hypothetical protein